MKNSSLLTVLENRDQESFWWIKYLMESVAPVLVDKRTDTNVLKGFTKKAMESGMVPFELVKQCIMGVFQKWIENWNVKSSSSTVFEGKNTTSSDISGSLLNLSKELQLKGFSVKPHYIAGITDYLVREKMQVLSRNFLRSEIVH